MSASTLTQHGELRMPSEVTGRADGGLGALSHYVANTAPTLRGCLG